MEVCIVKPDRIFFKEEAEELLLPTSTGYIGILKEHAPLVTGLDNGVLAVRQGTSWKILAMPDLHISLRNRSFNSTARL